MKRRRTCLSMISRVCGRNEGVQHITSKILCLKTPEDRLKSFVLRQPQKQTKRIVKFWILCRSFLTTHKIIVIFPCKLRSSRPPFVYIVVCLYFARSQSTRRSLKENGSYKWPKENNFGRLLSFASFGR